MDAIYYAPDHKHHFRNVEIKSGKATLKDDDGRLIYAGVEVSEKPETGKCVIIGGLPKETKPSK